MTFRRTLDIVERLKIKLLEYACTYIARVEAYGPQKRFVRYSISIATKETRWIAIELYCFRGMTNYYNFVRDIYVYMILRRTENHLVSQ